MTDTKISPDGESVAIRRPEESGGMAWGVMTIKNGGHYASDAEVADWTDLVAVETPEPDPEAEGS